MLLLLLLLLFPPPFVEPPSLLPPLSLLLVESISSALKGSEGDREGIESVGAKDSSLSSVGSSTESTICVGFSSLLSLSSSTPLLSPSLSSFSSSLVVSSFLESLSSVCSSCALASCSNEIKLLLLEYYLIYYEQY
jgi:hypothetical protein